MKDIKTSIALSLALGFFTAASAIAQTQLWKYTPPPSISQPASIRAVDAVLSDGAQGAAVLVHYYISNGPEGGYRFVWLNRTGKVIFTEELSERWDIVRATPKVVVLVSGRKLRRYSFVGSRAVTKETMLETGENFEEFTARPPDAAGFFTVRFTGQPEIQELRRWKN